MPRSNRRAVIVIDVEQQKARRAVSSLSGEFVQLERASRDAVSGVERHAQQAAGAVQRLAARSDVAASNVNRLAQRSNQTSNELRSFRGRSARANNLLFEMGAAAQDARYGVQGVANQVPLMLEQFTQMKTQTGSTRGALAALVSGLTGPGGLILAFGALTALGPTIASWFNDREEEADELSKRLEELTKSYENAASQIANFESGLPGVDLTAENIGRVTANVRKRTEAARENLELSKGWLETAKQQVSATEGLLETLEKTNQESTQQYKNAQRRLEARRKTVALFERQVEGDRNRLTQLEGQLDYLQEQRQEYQRQRQMQEGLVDAGASRTEQQKKQAEAAKNLADTERKIREARLRLAGATEEEVLKNRLRHIERRMKAEKKASEAYLALLERELNARLALMEKARQRLAAYAQEAQRIAQQARAATQSAQERSAQARSEGDASAFAFDPEAQAKALQEYGRNLKKWSAKARAEIESTEEASVELSGFLQSSIPSAAAAAGQALAAAFQGADDAAERLLATLGSIVSQLGNRLIQQALTTSMAPGSTKTFAGAGGIAGLVLSIGGSILTGGLFAEGGTVRGPGGPTSDRVPIMASNGEEVIRAKAAKMLRPQLKVMNAYPERFASGGTVDFSGPDFSQQLEKLAFHTSGGGGGMGSGQLVQAIDRVGQRIDKQTERLEKVERRIALDPFALREGMDDHDDQQGRIG